MIKFSPCLSKLQLSKFGSFYETQCRTKIALLKNFTTPVEKTVRAYFLALPLVLKFKFTQLCAILLKWCPQTF